MRYYIADNHYNHFNINRMDNRGFLSNEEMTSTMIDNHNSIVRKNDECVFVGDAMLARATKDAEDILKQLNGKKYLIIGNHDRYLKYKDFDLSLFEWVKDYAELNDNNRKVVLSHYPIMFYNGQYRGNSTYHICGHVHDTKDNFLLEKFILETRATKTQDGRPIPCNIINAFAKFSDYKPLTLDEWIKVTEKRLTERQNSGYYVA